MSDGTTLTILPDIGGIFTVRDFADGGAVKQMYLPILKPEPFEITINNLNGRTVQSIVRQKLKELVEESIEVGMASDVNFLVEEEIGSPPIKILRDQNWRDAIRLSGNNTFQVVKVRRGFYNVSMRSFGRERVFKLAPDELVYDRTNYFQPDRENLLMIDADKQASCGFQYIYETFGNTNGYKKKARDFKTIKTLSQTDPPQFRNWITQYQKEYNLEELGLNTQYPVVELDSFEDELFNLEVLDLKPDEYSEDEEFNSMSVLDIIRWSMWAGVSCYVIDYDGHYYLSYNHGQLSKDYTDTTKKYHRSIVLKVVNKHAYFVDDRHLKCSVSTTLTKYQLQDFEDVSSKKPKDNISDPLPSKKGSPDGEDNEIDEFYKYEEELKEWVKRNQSQFYLSPYFKVKTVLEDKKFDIYDPKNWMSLCDTDPRENLEEAIEQISYRLYRDNPPPQPEEFLADENKTFYLQARSLNGIVSYLKHNHGVSPNTMNGQSPHNIDRATYGKTKLMSRRCNSNCFNQECISGIQYIFEKFPKLNLNRLPTATAIANEIFKTNYDDKRYWSMFNSNTKRAFMDGEIKADNRVIKEEVENNIFSVDLKRAYTNSLRGGDIKWGMYDGICQFQKYHGEFNPECFYLVKELVDEYPMRGVKGLVLYHGVFLRSVLDKVEIKYIIRPVETKDTDYFKTFVEKCEEFEEETDGLITSKSLVNNFIGGMKKQDSISNYKIYETESNTTLTRAFYTGCIVSNLDKNTEWNRTYRMCDNDPIRLISNPMTNHNIQSAQPIRLQVMDSINEKLYKLYLDYKVVFGRCPIVMTRTDALYIEDPQRTEEEINKFCDNQTVLCEKEKDIDKEYWEYKKTPPQQKKVNFTLNSWEDKVDINKPWSMDYGAKALYNLINTGGGAMLNGEAGVGKSELTNYISETIEGNRKDYRWVKLIMKLTSNNPHAALEEWRDARPCFAIKLAPTNKACNRIGGQTLNKGLGIPVLGIDPEEDEAIEDPIGYFEKKIARIIGGVNNKPCADFVAVDEISMIGGYFWSILLAIKHRAPRIKFLLSGDIMRQLPPVGEENRNFIGAYLIKELSNFQQINLNYNFRNKLKGNILWDEWSKDPKRFKVTPQQDKLTTLNLCYLNKTRKRIIADWNKILKPFNNRLCVYDYEGYAPFKKGHTIYKEDEQTDEIYIIIGTPMIANKSLSDYGIAKNEMWVVNSIGAEDIKLSYEDNQITMSKEDVYKNFYSGYAISIHKSQGDTYSNQYTIWDWDKLSGERKLNRKLRYVAQSRSKKPDKNILYKV
tara:strand:- start:514 stop:4368 length:3855 start_codon:yes stop_codon:yes gene_type:complete